MWNVIAKAIAKDPAERYPSANALAEALEQLIANDFIAPSQPELPLLEGGCLVLRFDSKEAWEKAWREQISQRRYFVPHQALPAGSLPLRFEVNASCRPSSER